MNPTPYLPRRELEASLRLPGRPGLRPSRHQSVAVVADLLLDLGAEHVVVLAFDGLGFDLARDALAPAQLVALTTTFPSTSITAWTTLLTGARPGDHGLVGAQIRAQTGDRLVDCFSETAGLDVAHLPPTVFERFSDRGARCHVALGEMATWPTWWRSFVTRGASVLAPADDWDLIRDDLPRTVAAVRTEVLRGVRASASAPSVVWCWINIDDHVHRHGVTREVVRAVGELARLAEELADRGRTVVAVSDHGLVPARCPTALRRRWDRLTGPGRCRLPSGGAGRVRWCYPEAGRAEELHAELADLLGDQALVVWRDELDEWGLLPATTRVRRAVGELVCLAVGPRFPLPVPGLRYEHGSVTPAEMIVPVAVWPAR